MNNQKKSKWDDVYENNFNGMWYPSEGIIKFSARYLKRRIGVDSWQEKKHVERILDAGCGIGRNVLFFQEQGYDTYGIDISEQAVTNGNEWLCKRKLKPSLMVGSVTEIPFAEQFFDVVISDGVLDHVPFSDAKIAMNQIKRVLAKQGYLYLTLRSSEDCEFDRGQKIDHNSFLLENGYEKGLIQHFFDLKEINELLQDFKIIDFELYEEKFLDEYTVDKSFLQSSKGLKKYVDFSKPLNMNLKYSRWHLAAEKI